MWEIIKQSLRTTCLDETHNVALIYRWLGAIDPRPVYHEHQPIKSWPGYRRRSITVNSQRSIHCNRRISPVLPHCYLISRFAREKHTQSIPRQGEPNVWEIHHSCSSHLSQQCWSPVWFERLFQITFRFFDGFRYSSGRLGFLRFFKISKVFHPMHWNYLMPNKLTTFSIWHTAQRTQYINIRWFIGIYYKCSKPNF